MTTLEAVGFFIAAVRVVAPDALDRSTHLAVADDLLDWIANDHPVEQIVASLSDAERADLRAVLEGMLRERDLQRDVSLTWGGR